MKSFYQSLLVLVLSVLYLNSSAQLNFTPTSNTATITTALQGRGVTISGLTIGGNGAAELANSIGTFTAGKSNLAFPNIRIASGLVITTGSATNATDSTSSVKGPNNHMGISLGDPLPTISTDNDLDQVTTFDKFDLRYITFTIVPDGNILTGTIVFASEEYPTYVGSAFNDACAIIIDGPGIVNNGGYTDLDANVATNSRNLAVFSSGNSLAINEVNSGTPGSQNDGITTINTLNSDFYIRNYYQY
ncbi:MAG: choice-of-anchor L domain-containing protein [Chitinophagaceae bacterium]